MAPARPPSLAFAGAGMITAVHGLAAQAAGMPVVAVASRTAQRAAATAANLPGAAVVGYGELPAGADVVVVATPPQAHAAHSLDALAAGAAVVCEKPLCTTLADADRLVEAVVGTGHRFLYAENLAYAPVTRAFLERLPAIGPVHHLDVRFLQALPTWSSGFLEPEWGGGVLFDLGAHPLALAMLTAAPARVAAVRAELSGSRDGSHPTDEHAEVELTFTSGLRATVVASWRGPAAPSWSWQAASPTGVLRAEFHPHPELEVNGTPVALPPARHPVPVVEQLGYVAQLQAFAADLAAGRRPYMDVGFGRAVLHVVCACYASAASGGDVVTVPFDGPRDRTPFQLWRGRP